jgi:hypothetical protein
VKVEKLRRRKEDETDKGMSRGGQKESEERIAKSSK